MISSSQISESGLWTEGIKKGKTNSRSSNKATTAWCFCYSHWKNVWGETIHVGRRHAVPAKGRRRLKETLTLTLTLTMDGLIIKTRNKYSNKSVWWGFFLSFFPSFFLSFNGVKGRVHWKVLGVDSFILFNSLFCGGQFTLWRGWMDFGRPDKKSWILTNMSAH